MSEEIPNLGEEREAKVISRDIIPVRCHSLKEMTTRPVFLMFRIWLAFSALLVCVAGIIGVYWGSLVLRSWPPLTWNNFLDGICMFCFGFVLFGLVFEDTYSHEMRSKELYAWFRFLETCLGRGLFLLYIGFRTVILGKHFCVIAGTLVMMNGASNWILHFVYEEKIEPPTKRIDEELVITSKFSKIRAKIIFNCITALIGLLIVAAGIDGMYWGGLVLLRWPPLTWNNFTGGLMMIFMGILIIIIVIKDCGFYRLQGLALFDFLTKWFSFLDSFIGRGMTFIYVGTRCIPLGKEYNFVVGVSTVLFGLVHFVLQWLEFPPEPEQVVETSEPAVKEEDDDDESTLLLESWGAKPAATHASLTQRLPEIKVHTTDANVDQAIVTEAEKPKAEPPKEPPKAEPPKVEPPKVEPPKVEPPAAEPPKAEADPKAKRESAAKSMLARAKRR